MSNPNQDRRGVGIFSKAKRVLRASTNASKQSLKPISENHPLTDPNSNEKSTDPEKDGYDPSGSTSTSPKEPQKNQEEDDRDRRAGVRTIPPWIQSFEDGEDDTEQDARSYLLPNVPATSRAPHHNYMPEPNTRATRGRRFDYAREAEPVTARRPLALVAPHWQSFTAAATPPRMPDEPGTVMSEGWRKENMADLEGPWNPAGMDDEQLGARGFWLFSPERRSATARRTHRILMHNSFVPLGCRLLIFIFVCLSLGLSASIFKRTNELNDSSAARAGTETGPGSDPDAICEQQPSTYLAIVMGCVAMIYTIYITWDEFASKPLGLRKASAKMRLLFLDPILLMFSAANTGIAFNTYIDKQWACYENAPNNLNNLQAAQSVCIRNADLCGRQKALSGILILVLISWMFTFAVSVLRVVERTAR